MRKRLRSPRGLATVHTPEGMPLPPKILVCAVIVKIRDEHRLRGWRRSKTPSGSSGSPAIPASRRFRKIAWPLAIKPIVPAARYDRLAAMGPA
jgi:hypothetical protein